jgi:tetratricopeptide (TPR) repeat protein
VFKWRKLKIPKIALLIGLIVLFVAIGFGAQVLVRQLQTDKAQEGAPPAVREVQEIANTGNQEEVDKKINEKLQDSRVSDNEKYLLYQQQGSRFMQKGDAQAAVEAYTKGFAIRETFEMAQAVAGAYWQSGNNEKAIEYYRKAIELVPADHAVRDDEIESMNMMIKMIEEGR